MNGHSRSQWMQLHGFPVHQFSFSLVLLWGVRFQRQSTGTGTGIPVIALKMAGTVPEHADLVVTDPIQAGVFAVMHISSKAVFDINRVRGREF